MDFQPSLAGEWERNRVLTLDVADYLATMGNRRDWERAEKLTTCCRELYCDVDYRPERKRFWRVVDTNLACGLRECPMCRWRRSGRRWKEAYQGFPELRKSYPTGRFLHVTLTDRNVALEEVPEAVGRLKKGQRKLLRRKAIRHQGYLWGVEVTRSADGAANQHIHLLLMVPAGFLSGRHYLSRSAWQELWRVCLGVDFDPEVPVRPLQSVSEEGLREEVANVAGYACKAPDQKMVSDPEWYLRYLDNRRGNWYGKGGAFREYFKRKRNSGRRPRVRRVYVLEWGKERYRSAGMEERWF
jgi:plasmid rolling circle replication initiator protein Rep